MVMVIDPQCSPLQTILLKASAGVETDCGGVGRYDREPDFLHDLSSMFEHACYQGCSQSRSLGFWPDEHAPQHALVLQFGSFRHKKAHHTRKG